MNDNSLLIDRYLQNEMSAEERATFESQLAADKSLQEEFIIQQQIIKAAETAGLKTEFGKAIKKRMISRRLIQWGIIVAIITAAFLFYAKKNDLFTQRTNSVEKEETKGLPAAEKFDINNAADTIIETRDGVVFAIPAHAFNSKGNNIHLEIRTALNAYDILQNGLSTTSNDALLQTAGMFYINGFEGDQQVLLVKEIAISVPASEINPAMQLFDGKEGKDGNIDWINPKPVEKRLRTYDINTLDFYPPAYIPTLKALQKNSGDKTYTDSLYYSFSGFPYRGFKVDTISKKMAGKKDALSDPLENRDTGKVKVVDSNYANSYEIDPARIRAIWNKRFNNTILATKEFEERLRFIHDLCTSLYLDIYLKNLDKSLYQADQLCADRSSGEVRKKLLEFAARKDGAVLIADGLQQKLNNYFQQKYVAYKEAAAKTWAKYEAELLRLNTIADTKRRTEELNNFTRENKNFLEELCVNLTDAYRQIGIKRSCNDTVVPLVHTYYNITISTMGWKNLDVYVLDATTSRQSMTYRDSNTGKTATLTYKEVNIQIENQSQYDRILVYLIPDSLSSFQRVEQQENMFKKKLNSLFRYDAVVLAYKGTQAFFYREQNLQPTGYVFGLLPVSDEILRSALRDYSFIKSTSFQLEFEYQLFEQQEAIRQLQLRKDQQFREQVAGAIFNCARAK